MSELERIDNHDIEEIITPAAADFAVVREQIEALLEDDPSLSLETASAEDLNRLQLNFVAWQHTIENAPALAQKIIESKPDVLIFEAVGDTQQYRRQDELITNLLLHDFPVIIKTKSGIEYAPVFPDPPIHELDVIRQRIKDARQAPIIRKMDLDDEEAANLGFNHNDALTLTYRLTHGPDWHLRHPRDELKDQVYKALMYESQVNWLRETAMMRDTSKIAANALACFPGDVKVMACFGNAHTSVARYFQKMPGVDAKLDILGIDRPGKLVFPPYTRLVREGSLKGRLSEKYLKEYMLGALLVPRFMIHSSIDSPETDIYDRLESAQELGGLAIRQHGEQLWNRWGEIYKKGFIRGRQKLQPDKAAELEDFIYDLSNAAR